MLKKYWGLKGKVKNWKQGQVGWGVSRPLTKRRKRLNNPGKVRLFKTQKPALLVVPPNGQKTVGGKIWRWKKYTTSKSESLCSWVPKMKPGGGQAGKRVWATARGHLSNHTTSPTKKNPTNSKKQNMETLKQ